MLENILFETHFSIIPFPIYVVDVHSWEIIFVNNSFMRLYGAVKGRICYAALFGREKPCMHCKIKDLVTADGKPNGRSIVFELYHDVDDCWYQLQEKAISWPDGRTAKYSIAVDINELKLTQNRLAEAHAELSLKNRELERLSTTDALTGVANRHKIQQQLVCEMERARRHQRPLGLLFIDLDHFKAVNDDYGHQAGDAVLQHFARLATANIRAADALGRWGGEEFLLICPEADLLQAVAVAEKLRQQVRESEFPAVARVTASFGVTVFQDGDTVESLVHRADKALYRAKENGRDCVETLV
ncbi:GGDEF domain-containing protein [Megalodesulfovibrio gigas]|uniref:diguanylate cyclase n=1 Tax=Megalodesulfovibrio gigas (strain ATCC 19364 / DSM 1382 / NCIMB 9332 / VKM B-1759) TaxID=1121448 RepID=T2G7A4_MEGG1|nr:GGDEF domain-containing protein [Megalodesulfovibrio gigas]AGW12480.1 putative GGDEF domain protein [Megalodesulfovibrio gigas DSM 1382 = ATCC 19364]